jgi:hypothetical protein
MKEKISRNKISRHYKSFFGLENMELAENDNLMIDWGESLINEFVNQEVERRIAGVMPTKNEIGNAAQLFDKQKRPLWKEAIWRAGANWAIDIIRSRLSQKTDNLKENNNGSTN